MFMEEDVKRWTVCWNSSPGSWNYIRAKTTAGETSRHYDLTLPDVVEWVEQGMAET